ncbi:hypothetical protein [Streptomyces sp. NPDC052015]
MSDQTPSLTESVEKAKGFRGEPTAKKKPAKKTSAQRARSA